MAFKFEELKVWQMALEHCNKVDLLAKDFPKFELFSLSSQIKRAADSVVLNIALRSGIEVVACLHIARTRKYCTDESFQHLYSSYEILCRMISKLRDSLK